MRTDLTPPEQVLENGSAQEILRVWAVDGDAQHFAIAPDVWSDPATWGLMLVDIARHVARGLARASDQSEADVLARIKAGFDVEWEDPTG